MPVAQTAVEVLKGRCRKIAHTLATKRAEGQERVVLWDEVCLIYNLLPLSTLQCLLISV